LILILTLLSAGMEIAAAADPIVSIKPAVKDVDMGEDFSIFIEVDPNGNAVGVALLNMAYDPTKVSITDVVMNGVDFPVNEPGDATVAGQITSIMGLSFTGLTTAANLAEIRMHANAAGTFTVGISGELKNPPGDPLTPVTMNTGEIRIKIPGEPLDVTVLHPNGGESIPIGTQVQVSAHATDDTAVTSVTFYYSNNSGSDWNSIGAGTRVSGTAKNGIWNRTWNTNSLGAGSNYLIRAVAYDGTSPDDDRSDSTFSLTCTPPSAPVLNDPGTTDTDGSYTVAWSSVSGATSYTLEEDTSGSFGSPTVVYSGSGTSTQIIGRGDGTYYYRANACNACGCSGWSNVEDIEVFIFQEECWNMTFGGTGDDVAYSVQQTSDGGFILAGYTDSYGAGSSDFWLVKTDSSGNKQWDQTFGGANSDIARSVYETSNGGYIIAGCTDYSAAGMYDARLVRMNSNRDLLWDMTLGGTGWDTAESVQETSDGGVIFAGYTGTYGAGYYDAWLVKIDPYGCIQWDKTFGGSGRDVATSVQETSDGGYIIAGSTQPQGGYLFSTGFMSPIDVDFADAWLVKIDSNGNKQWDKTFGGTDWDTAESVQETSDGGYILAGYTKSYGAGGSDFWLIKTYSNGNKQWDKTFGETDDDYAYSVQQTSDGGYILAGVMEPHSEPPAPIATSMSPCGAGSSDVWLVKTDSEGGKEWDKTFGGTGDDCASSVQQTSDGGYILAGYTKSYGAGGSDFWLIKLGTAAQMRGDLNGDNQITPADAAIALQLAATGGWDPAADIDGDRRITSLDALMILQAAAGAIAL
jgi:hypothetical protein